MSAPAVVNPDPFPFKQVISKDVLPELPPDEPMLQTCGIDQGNDSGTFNSCWIDAVLHVLLVDPYIRYMVSQYSADSLYQAGTTASHLLIDTLTLRLAANRRPRPPPMEIFDAEARFSSSMAPLLVRLRGHASFQQADQWDELETRDDYNNKLNQRKAIIERNRLLLAEEKLPVPPIPADNMGDAAHFFMKCLEAIDDFVRLNLRASLFRKLWRCYSCSRLQRNPHHLNLCKKRIQILSGSQSLQRNA